MSSEGSYQGQVENTEKDEKVVKCEKSCLLNQNMGKKPLWQTKDSIRKTKKKFPSYIQWTFRNLRGTRRLHYISPSNLCLLLLLLSLQLRDLSPYASIQGLIRPSPPCHGRLIPKFSCFAPPADLSLQQRLMDLRFWNRQFAAAWNSIYKSRTR